MLRWSKRITALAFIGLVILGNIWLMGMITGTAPPPWTATGFFVFIVVAALGGIGMLIAKLTERPESSL